MAIPKARVAALVETREGRERVVVREEKIPKVGDEEVLIEVEFSGVNYLDSFYKARPVGMEMISRVSLPMYLGLEVGGKIIATGDNVEGLQVGDRVAAVTLPQLGGGYTTHAIARAAMTRKLPRNVGTKEGAASLLQGLVVLSLCKEVYCVREGDYALVHTFGGGLGLMLIQALKHLGAHVIGTTATSTKIDLLKACGADNVVLQTGDWPAEVLRLTTAGGEKGAHVVYDPIGRATWDGSLWSVRRKGTFVSFGAASGSVGFIDVNKLAPHAVRLVRFSLFEWVRTKEELTRYFEQLFDLLGRRVFNVPFHNEPYPMTLEGIVAAHREITETETRGKLMLQASVPKTAPGRSRTSASERVSKKAAADAGASEDELAVKRTKIEA